MPRSSSREATMSVRAVPLSGDDRERPEGSFGRPLAGGVGGCNGERVDTGVELPRARQPALEEELMRASAGVERERAYGHAAGARLAPAIARGLRHALAIDLAPRVQLGAREPHRRRLVQRA